MLEAQEDAGAVGAAGRVLRQRRHRPEADDRSGVGWRCTSTPKRSPRSCRCPEAVVDDADARRVGACFAPGWRRRSARRSTRPCSPGRTSRRPGPRRSCPPRRRRATSRRPATRAAEGGVVGDLDETFDLVEADGFDVNGRRRAAQAALAAPQGARQRRTAARGRVDDAGARRARSRTSPRARSSTRRSRSWATSRWRSSASGRT